MKRYCYNLFTTGKRMVQWMIKLKIKEVAEQKKMSMRKLVKESGIAYNTLRTIYRDPYRQVNTETLDRLAIALGVDVRELLESVPDENA
jgi:DNA-binding Xre family transcriptional regulator